jgi:hypothetical protein
MSYPDHPLSMSLACIRDAEGTIFGAGFVVAPNLVCTCAHVVANALGMRQTPEKAPDALVHLDFPFLVGMDLTASIVSWKPIMTNESGDIAVLRLTSALPTGLKIAPLLLEIPLPMRHFEVYGFPIGNDIGAWARGELSYRRPDGSIQIEDTKITGYRIQPGFSGAPVWDVQGRGVVGMVVEAELDTIAKVGFLIPTSELVEVCSEMNQYINISSSIPPNLTTPFEYACYISYPLDLGGLVEDYVTELRESLYMEMSAYGKQYGQIYSEWKRFYKAGFDHNDLSRKLCKSVCMIIVFTPAYFDSISCSIEYKAMEALEKRRFTLLGDSFDKNQRLIIPLIVRGRKSFPEDITQLEIGRINDFQNYTPGKKILKRKQTYANQISQIAEYVVDNCIRFKDVSAAFSDCENFIFPSEEEIKDWQQKIKSPSQIFPMRQYEIL